MVIPRKANRVANLLENNAQSMKASAMIFPASNHVRSTGIQGPHSAAMIFPKKSTKSLFILLKPANDTA
jgi:hypothetical protein